MRLNIGTTVLIALLVTSLSLNWRQWLYKKKSDERISELVELGGKAKIVTRYVRDSIQHTVFEQVYVKDNASRKRLAITKSYADSLECALQMSIDKIASVTKTNAKLTARLKVLQNEAGKPPSKHYSDKYLSLAYDPANDSLWLSYDISLNTAKYTKKKWLFGEKQHFIDVWADDPRVKIQGLKTFTIAQEPPRRWSLALQGGYGVTLNAPFRFTPYVGAGLSYHLIHF